MGSDKPQSITAGIIKRLAESTHIQEKEKLSKLQSAIDKKYGLDKYTVLLAQVPVPNKEKGKEKEREYMRYYAVDLTSPIGNGATADVVHAYPITSENVIDTEKSCIAKIWATATDLPSGIDLDKMAKQEVIRLHQSGYKAALAHLERPGKPQRLVTFMPYFEGEELYKSFSQRLRRKIDFSRLNFLERAEVAFQIALELNNFHSDKRGHGKLAVLDLKAENIVFDSKKRKNKPKQFDIHFIDFGGACELEKSALTPQLAPLYTPESTAPEILSSSQYRPTYSTSADIFSLTDVMLSIFGAYNSCADRAAAVKDGKIPTTIPFNFDGIFEGSAKPPLYPHAIEEWICRFLDRMQNVDLTKRPDSDEVLRFFSALRNYAEIFKTAPKDMGSEAETIENKKIIKENHLNSYAAQMALLAGGMWNENIGTRTIEHFVDKKPLVISQYGANPAVPLHKTDESQEMSQTFEQFDFADEKNQGKIRLIMMLDDIGKLNKENIVSNKEEAWNYSEWKKQFGVLSKKLSVKQLLKHLELLDRYREELEPFSHLRTEIITRLFESCKLNQYHADKIALVVKGQKYSGMFHGKFHGKFTIRNKLDAFQALSTVIESNDCSTETISALLKKHGPALKQGTLGKLAKPLIEFLEKKIKQPIVAATESSERRP